MFFTAPHYQIYQSLVDLAYPARTAARLAEPWLRYAMHGRPDSHSIRRAAALCEQVALAGLSHERPPFAIDQVSSAGESIRVDEEVAYATPFASLLHFRKDCAHPGPKVLLIAPISGHFATLLRNTAHTLLQHHDVYVTDWHNIRDVPLRAGRFGLDEFIDHIIDFIDWLGPETHVVSVCQPTVGTLAAIALMAQDGSPHQPRSMTLMAGPIDCRINPTIVNKLAADKPIEWFERKLIGTVPLRYRGALRRVYPGFLQIAAFMSMNAQRHQESFSDMYQSRVAGEHAKATAFRDFYDEYLAMMDLSAEFYLETVSKVFQQHELPRGVLEHRGRRVNPAAIRHTALLTVEGEKDDICAVGQTWATHDLCSGLAPERKQHHLQTGVGHYGVFSGKRWERQIYPRVRAFIQGFDA